MLRHIAVFVLIMAISTTLACGSEGANETNAPTPEPRLSLNEYFGSLSAAFDRLEQKLAISAQVPDPQSVDTPEKLLGVFQDTLTEVEMASAVFIDEIESLMPPNEATEAHQEFLQALRSDHETISDLAKDVRDTKSIEAATAALQSGASPLARSRAPCWKLQGIARQHNIAVELPCAE